MQISYNGVQALKEREGCKLTAYQDQHGVWTLGVGTTMIEGRPVQEGMTCTPEQATQWMWNDLAWAQTAVNQGVKVVLNQDQFDALVSFTYNEGAHAFLTSTLLQKLNQQDFIGAGNEFRKWIYVGKNRNEGLVNRRESELAQFEGRPHTY
jgi:GH24 family phage-related lysozyme (muramidase)